MSTNQQTPLSARALSVAEAARYLGAQPPTVRRWIRGHGLVAHRRGRLWCLPLPGIHQWLRATNRRPGASAHPFAAIAADHTVSCTLPRVAPVTRQLYASLAALHAALTDQAALAAVDYFPESPSLWTSSLRLDASAGGLWDRTFSTGVVPGDGLTAHLLLVVAGRLSVELSWPLDSMGDVAARITGERAATERARQSLEALRARQASDRTVGEADP